MQNAQAILHVGTHIGARVVYYENVYHMCTHDFLQKPVDVDGGVADFLQKISARQVVQFHRPKRRQAVNDYKRHT